MLSINTFTPQLSFGSNTYILESGGEYAVIDPSADLNTVLLSVPEIKSTLKYIIVTHAHFDHISELDAWQKETGAPVLISSYDAPALSDSYKNAYRVFYGVDKGYYGPYTELTGGERLPLGDEVLEIIHTPGHTIGGISILTGKNLFVGDTVFADGGYGRCDLYGGDFSTLFASIRYILKLDSDISVYPGHGRSTSIKEIRRFFSNL